MPWRDLYRAARTRPRPAGACGDRQDGRRVGRVLGVPVDRISLDQAGELICVWAARHSPRMVLAANVHMTMEAFDDPAFRRVMDEADLVVADGRPLAWVLKARGCSDVHHVRGQDLVLAVCRAAEERGLGVGMYGTTPGSLATAERHLLERHPRLKVVYSYSPPFRDLTEEEDREVTAAIRRSGAQVVLVATGCPKQEKWMAAHVTELDSVLIGAGAAIDMLGGLQPVAPRWMQVSGLEWVFRLASNPARLWRRYAKHNSRFALLAGAEVLTAGLNDICRMFGRPRD